MLPPLLPEQLQAQPLAPLLIALGVPDVHWLALSGPKILGAGLAQTPCTAGATEAKLEMAAQPASSRKELLVDAPTTAAPRHALTEKLLDVASPPEVSRLPDCMRKLVLLADAAQSGPATTASSRMPRCWSIGIRINRAG